METLSESLGAQINIVARALRVALEKELASEEVSPSQWMLMMALGEKDHQGQSELGKILHLDNATITRIVDKLQDKGLMVRNQDRADRRAQIVSLTDKGRTTYIRWNAIGAKVNQEATQNLTPEEIKELLQYLAIVKYNLDLLNGARKNNSNSIV